MLKLRLDVEHFEVETFETEGILESRGTVLGNVSGLCSGDPEYTCGAENTCNGDYTCNGETCTGCDTAWKCTVYGECESEYICSNMCTYFC